jgi:nitrite reductase/ring-hydroxylating ferredoxin subunit
MSQPDGKWHGAGRADQLALDSIAQRRVAGRKLVIGRVRDGYFAIDDVCPHAGASLGFGTLEGNALVCPLHGWEFDVFSGECAMFGAIVASHPIRVIGEQLEVQL